MGFSIHRTVTKKTAGRYRTYLRWVLAAVILAYVVYFLFKNKSQLTSLKQISPLMLLGLFIFNLFNNLIYAWRLHIIIRKISGVVLPVFSWLKFFLISRFLGLYAGQAGNIYRATVLKSRYNISITKYISSFVFITWIDTCLGILFGVAVISIFAPTMMLFGLNAIGLLLIVFIVQLIVPLMIYWILSRIKLSGRFLTWLHGRLSLMVNVMASSLKDPVYLFKVSLTGFISFINSTIVIYLCFWGLGLDISLSGAALFFTVAKLSNRLIITPGNLGIREVVYGVVSEQVGVGMSQGILASVVIRVVNLLTTTVLGIAVGGYDMIKHPLKNADGLDAEKLEQGDFQRRAD